MILFAQKSKKPKTKRERPVEKRRCWKMSTTLLELYRSYKTIIEMLRDRGFLADESFDFPQDPSTPEIVPEKFVEWVGEDVSDARKELQLDFDHTSATKPSVMLFWTDSFGTDDIHWIHGEMTEKGFTHAIVIHNRKITSGTVTIIKSLRVQNIIIEPFTEKETQFNVTHHVYVPRHIICSAKKTAEILEKYHVTKEQIPKIQSATDAVCRYLGARKGQLIKILRPSESIGEVTVNGKKTVLYDVTYRIVV
jgi:DNA-directed RNA polymerase I, II, and III subunit RPABC1